MSFEWGMICRPKQGQSVSGDTYVIEQLDENRLVVSVIDGLGGGEAAAHAANGAAAVVREHPALPLEQLIRQAHTALHGTRGAVISVLRLDRQAHRVDYIGVGNIGIYVYSQLPIKPISKNGILGYRLPSLLQLHYTYNSGDTFVLYSDGVSARFSTDGKTDSSLAPQPMADQILADYGKHNDDATVVVVRAH